MNLDFGFLSWQVVSSFVLKGLAFSVQLTLIAMIGDAGGEPIRDPQPPLGLCEQQHAAVGCQPPAVERRGDFPSPNGWEGEGEPLSSAMAIVALSVQSRGMV